jgi:hypothetical protein
MLEMAEEFGFETGEIEDGSFYLVNLKLRRVHYYKLHSNSRTRSYRPESIKIGLALKFKQASWKIRF